MTKYNLSCELWKKIEPLLLPVTSSRNCQISDREAMEVILGTLCRCPEKEGKLWRLEMGDAVYRRFNEWIKTGVFDRMWQTGIISHDELKMLVRQV